MITKFDDFNNPFVPSNEVFKMNNKIDKFQFFSILANVTAYHRQASKADYADLIATIIRALNYVNDEVQQSPLSLMDTIAILSELPIPMYTDFKSMPPVNFSNFNNGVGNVGNNGGANVGKSNAKKTN